MAIDVQTKINLVTTDPYLAVNIRGGPEPRDEFLTFQLGRDYNRYLQMERDPEVRRSLARRRQMILGRRLIVEPASPSRVDKQAAKFCQGLLDGARPALRYQALNSALLHKGQLIGFAVVRLDWERVGDALLPTFQSVPQNRFNFAYAEPDRNDILVATDEKVDPKTDIVTIAGFELRLLTKRSPVTGERCPKKRFLVYTFDDEESPWGLGLGYSIYPYWTIKRESLKAWLLHSDRQGSPPVTGEHPQDVNEQTAEGAALIGRFERFLKSVSPNAWARLPVGWSAKILETVGTAGPEVHQQLIAECNREIQICTIGELLFSDKASGSYAANASQNDSEQALIDGDCAILDEQLADLWTWICELNSLKGDPPIVRRELFADVRKVEAEKEKEAAKESRLSRDKSLFDLGYRVKPDAIAEIYGEEYEPIAVDEPEQETALISVLGIPATQALMQFIQGLGNSGLSREAAIAVLTGVFGVDEKLAGTIVPEEEQQQQEESPSLESLLNSPEEQPTDNAQFDGLRSRILELSDRYLSVNMAERKFKRNQCEQGFSCGHNTCISQNLPCPNPLIGQSVNYAEWLRLAQSATAKQPSVPDLAFTETLNAIADGTWDYRASKPAPKKKNCNPAKSHFCQTANGAGSCVSLSKQCKYKPQGDVKTPANYVGQQVRQLESQIQQLQAQLAALNTPKPPQPGTVAEVDPSSILADPKRFQYKLLGEHTTTGEVGSLAGVNKFDPNLAGVIQAWIDPADGKTYVVNGHNRLALAKRLGADKVTVRYLDVKDAQEARAVGAITNVAEGRGTAVDAAKFFKDSGLTKDDLDRKGIPMREKIATDGIALSKLDDSLFRKVIDGDIPTERAVIIGGSGLDHQQQRSLVKLVDSQKRKVTNEVLTELVDTVKASEQQTTTQFDLFGASQTVVDNALERASLQAVVKKRLSREKKLFGTVGKSTAAQQLAQAGNVIDVASSQKVSKDASATLAVFDQLKNQSGGISRAINDAATQIEQGGDRKKIEANLYKEILQMVQSGNFSEEEEECLA